MSGPEQMPPEDLTDVAASDALLDNLAAARPLPVSELEDGEAALAGLLSTWRAELDDRAATVMTARPVEVPSRPSRWIRAHQRTAAATAVVVAIAASGGAAAAASGPTGPLGGLHRFIFGHPAVAPVDTLAAAADRLLQKVAQQIDAAKQAGHITAPARLRINVTLESAAALLARDTRAPQSLTDQLANLRTTLAAIPLVVPAPAPTVTDHHGHGASGSDDNQGDTRHGSGSDDNSGGDNRGSGSHDGSSHDDGSSQDGGSQGGGSDDGSGSGGDSQSGDGSGDSQSGDGGGDQSGDGGGTQTSGDGGSTQTSGDGSGSGIDDQSGGGGGDSGND